MSSTIKDFQRATAERILHIFKDMGHRRVLLADEVGLGKTFVAREVINLVRQWHRDELKDDFFKVVYICSNANIADQNIEKLGVANRMNISESRLSMQHLYITLANKQNMEKQKDGEMPESIIPLTPSTSFRFFSAQGTANERALMYAILRHLPVFRVYDDVLGNFLCCNVKCWQGNIDNYQTKIAKCGDEYLSGMLDKLQKKLYKELTDKVIDYAAEPIMKELMSANDYGKYLDKTTGKMQLCFLTNNDITGGNSGSPMFNGKGELIGLAFDGNWDSLSSDINFDKRLARCIGVDIRYVLYLMDKWGHADRLLKEINAK